MDKTRGFEGGIGFSGPIFESIVEGATDFRAGADVRGGSYNVSLGALVFSRDTLPASDDFVLLVGDRQRARSEGRVAG